jgi:hypothetical protein
MAITGISMAVNSKNRKKKQPLQQRFPLNNDSSFLNSLENVT